MDVEISAKVKPIRYVAATGAVSLFVLPFILFATGQIFALKVWVVVAVLFVIAGCIYGLAND